MRYGNPRSHSLVDGTAMGRVGVETPLSVSQSAGVCEEPRPPLSCTAVELELL